MRGVTLVELMVVLVILGLLTGVSALSVASLRPTGASRRLAALRAARAAAIHTGRAVTVRAEGGMPILFLPDGRAIGAVVSPFTGEPRDAAP
jgi:prepilin-type N-terminal cleavage/methylation domain-containing protein